MKSAFQISLFLLFLVSIESCQQQLWKIQDKPQRVTLTQGDSTISLNLTNEATDTDPDKTYYWFHDRQIISQRGGYAGKLLDGTYQVFDAQGKLKTKGAFEEGLKDGVWRFWFQGELVEQVEYRRGELHGQYFQFIDGNLRESGRHKSGYLDGTRTFYAISDTSNMEVIYKDGIPADTLITSR